MKKYALYAALSTALLFVPSMMLAGEPECYVSGFWIWKQTTCTYEHPEGALVIKTDHKGNVTSIERMPY